MYDLVIRNAQIIDGTGTPYYYADVAIEDGRIAKVGHVNPAEARSVYDAARHVLSPGFVDVHTHADHGVLDHPDALNYLRQGVTTIVGGNCGESEYPIGEHLDQLATKRLAINYGILVGHGTIREQVLGYAMRAPSHEELEEMKRLTAQAMTDGALGMSVGLYYAPGSYAQLDEVIELAKVVAEHHGIIAIHLRDESDYNTGLVESAKEAIRIAEEAQVPVQISHLKCLGKSVWGRSSEVLCLIEEARARGLDVTFDQYPYLAGSTGLVSAVFPRWSQEGGQQALVARSGDPSLRARIRAEVVANIERRGGPETLVIARYLPDPTLEGQSLKQVAELMKLEPADASIELQLQGGAKLVSFMMNDQDVETIMRSPLGMVGSDGSLVASGEGAPHPRFYGTFPRSLAVYVREKKVLRLEDAIRKMTSFPARRIGLTDRGMIREGAWADLVVFDPEQVGDEATFEQPHQYARGISLVTVAGKIVIEKEQLVTDDAGTILKKNALV